jgi:ABC-2 type transport system permease protein
VARLLTIARHEVRSRFFSKAIALNLLILVAVVSITPWIPKILEGESNVRLGIYSERTISNDYLFKLKQSLNQSARIQGFNLEFIQGNSLSDIISKEKNEHFTLAIGVNESNFSIKSFNNRDNQTLALLKNFSQALATKNFLQFKGISVNEFERLLANNPVLSIEELREEEKVSEERYFTALILNLLLFTLIVLASSHLVMGVVDEKSSRVMEILLYSIKPRELIIGKLLGISAFISLQFGILLAAGFASSSLAGVAEKADLSLGSISTVLLWFPPAFFFFAISYSAIGARISKVEELGAVQAPLMILVSASLYSSIFAIGTPDAQWVEILTYIPPFSFFIESSRSLLSLSSTTEEIVSWLIAMAATSLVAWVGIKSFEQRVFLDK